MTALRVARAFGRPDVDGFLQEISHEQYLEWACFFSLEPIDWQATQLAIRRLSYMIAQKGLRKRLKESNFEMQLGGNLRSADTEKVMWEAQSIRQNIAAGKAAG